MSTHIPTPSGAVSRADGEERIALRGVSWRTYEALARDLGDQPIRLTYDRGALELMSPSSQHERLKKLLGRLVESILEHRNVPFEPAGESRWSREAAERGLEADESYFLAPDKLAVVGGRAADRADDPLPDLAIEIDLSEPRIDRSSIYAALGVSEVWYYDGETLRIEWLDQDGTFQERAASRWLPVHAAEVSDRLRQAEDLPFSTWLAQLQDWVRDEVKPRQTPVS